MQNPREFMGVTENMRILDIHGEPVNSWPGCQAEVSVVKGLVVGPTSRQVLQEIIGNLRSIMGTIQNHYKSAET